MYDYLATLIVLGCLAMFILSFIYKDHKIPLLISSLVGWFVYPLILELLFSLCTFIFCQEPKAITKNLTKKVIESKLPINYSKDYNITACGLEKMHPFDSCKYEKIYSKLISKEILTNNNHFIPNFPLRKLYSETHNFSHLLFLNYSLYISYCVEVPLFFVPSEFLRFKLLNPMLYASQGTVDSACLSLIYGWSINLSGGYHHATQCKGQGFCIYSDIFMAVYYIRKWFNIKKFMVVDLDAHQGNGYQRDFLSSGFKQDVFIMDVYNPYIYPGDHDAREAIDMNIHVTNVDSTVDYLSKVENGLDDSFDLFSPQLLIYNAGTDCLEGDPLGNLNVSPDGIIKRDELVFRKCFERKIPILMLMSGGYQKSNGPLIGDSIINLFNKFKLNDLKIDYSLVN